MSVVPYRPQEDVPRRDWLDLMAPAVELAKAVCDTEFVPKGMRGNPAAIAACILYGDEIGLAPMRALAMIAVVDGRPSVYAEAMRALIIAAGHALWLEESTNTRVTWAGRRRGEDVTIRATWTTDDARNASLLSKDNWRKYPRAMLSARASADLARAHFADVIGGLPAYEEVIDYGDAPDELRAPTPISAAAAPASRRRRRSAPSQALSGAPAPSRDVPAPVEALPLLPGEERPAEPEPDPITDAQLRRLQALMRERGITGRAERLTYASQVVDRQIASSRQLTRAEATRVIGLLELDLSQSAPAAPQGPPRDPPGSAEGPAGTDGATEAAPPEDEPPWPEPRPADPEEDDAS